MPNSKNLIKSFSHDENDIGINLVTASPPNQRKSKNKKNLLKIRPQRDGYVYDGGYYALGNFYRGNDEEVIWIVLALMASIRYSHPSPLCEKKRRSKIVGNEEI